MNVSAKTEYGLRALVHLARHPAERTSAREIAAACEVPIKYLEQILGVLREGGLVEAQVGSAGGYRLVRPPRFTSVGEAVRLLDERLGLGDPPDPAARPDDPIHRLWARIEAAIVAVVDDVSLAELAADADRSKGARAS